MPGIAVIIGADASHDCADSITGRVNVDFRPPLVDQLFLNNGRFNEILNQYPGARALSSRIRSELSNKRGLEDILRGIAYEQDAYTRRQYVDVPPYLQELLGEVSRQFIQAGGNYYDMMVADIQRSGYEHILYVTVNYDLFLDRALTGFYYDSFFNHVDDYCPDGRKWSLVKLHGSVNWGRKLLNGKLAQVSSPFALNLSGEPELEDGIVLLGGFKEGGRIKDDAFHYPSLAPPLGAKDLACPRTHVDAMTRRIRDCSTMLFVGFSAMDSHIVEMFKLCQTVKRVGFVNENAESARQALGRCRPHNSCFNVVPEDVIYGMGFAQFVRSGKLHEFLSVVPK